MPRSAPGFTTFPSLPTCVRHRGARRLGYEGELEFSGGHVGEGQHETQARDARTGEAADVHRGVKVEAPAGGGGASGGGPGDRVRAEARAPLLLDECFRSILRRRPELASPLERVEFVARLFLDALFDAALHTSRHELDRALFLDPGCPVFVINSYNIINSPVTNLSHCAPQVLLGLFGDWDADAIDLLGPALAARLDTIRTRCRAAGVALEKVERFLADLAEDDDLFSIDFTSVGLGIPPKVRDTYLRALAKG